MMIIKGKGGEDLGRLTGNGEKYHFEYKGFLKWLNGYCIIKNDCFFDAMNVVSIQRDNAGAVKVIANLKKIRKRRESEGALHGRKLCHLR